MFMLKRLENIYQQFDRNDFLDYHWEELWRALITLLDFVSTKLVNSGKLEQLVQESIVLLDFALRHADCYLGSPKDIHQLIVSAIIQMVTIALIISLVRTGSLVWYLA